MCEPCTSRTLARALTPAPDGQHLLDPGPAGIDQRARLDRAARAGQRILDRDVPDAVGLPDLDRARAGADLGAAVGGIARVEHDEPRVVDEAVGIFEALGVAVGDQRLADLVAWRDRPSASAAAACGRRYGRRGTARAAAARPAASPAWCGKTKRSGRMMWGAIRQRISRSISASRTSRNS